MWVEITAVTIQQFSLVSGAENNLDGITYNNGEDVFSEVIFHYLV